MSRHGPVSAKALGLAQQLTTRDLFHLDTGNALDDVDRNEMALGEDIRRRQAPET